jgi:hypothetical protein
MPKSAIFTVSQAVVTCQVAVYKALSCQVLHPSSDLQSY